MYGAEQNKIPNSQEGELFLLTRQLVELNWDSIFFDVLKSDNDKQKVGAAMMELYLKGRKEEEMEFDELFGQLDGMQTLYSTLVELDLIDEIDELDEFYDMEGYENYKCVDVPIFVNRCYDHNSRSERTSQFWPKL